MESLTHHVTTIAKPTDSKPLAMQTNGQQAVSFELIRAQ